MDTEHFGTCLRRAREERALTVVDVAASTKVPRSSLERLEAGDLGALPAAVFVRGFIRSYARTVGMNEIEPLQLYDRAVRARTEAKRAQSTIPVVDPTIAGIGGDPSSSSSSPSSDEGLAPRRGLGLAVFVIILLLIATITLSLLLRRPPQSGEGLSQARPVPAGALGSGPAGSRGAGFGASAPA